MNDGFDGMIAQTKTLNALEVAAMERGIFRAVGTPVTRLAAFIVEALDAGDTEMARRCAQRLVELGGKR